MKPSRLQPALYLIAGLTIAGCVSSPAKQADVPAALRAAPDQSMFLEALASGVQIYECSAKPDMPAAYAWKFKGPEATLLDRAGQPLGKHFGGPTWESIDGSRVVGAVVGSDPGPDAAAIPWLLLSARSTSGSGVLGKTTSIQRLFTSAGLAPSTPCTAAIAQQVARVPYTATYRFYRQAN
ncbi:hypothetical protein RCH09_002093 [Actimicrobium sp. GrIS 1.19]|uniref:DUF3455 domain-containing protein n=1 Tax=Actimicrobium sp. GrIS 1.19 TaxID=3071708 RepID=UPI002E0C8F07|nr:hypothetical protein [Actimicrobium sp. GrIS 1.19]